jgi:hypothetical protein
MLQRLKTWAAELVASPKLASDVGVKLLEELGHERRRRTELEKEIVRLKSSADGPFRTVVELRGKLRNDDGRLVQTYRGFSVGKEFWLRRGERRRETFRVDAVLFEPVVVIVQGPGLIALAAVKADVWARGDTSGSGGVLSCSLGDAPLDPAWGVDVEVVSSMPPEGA